MVASPPSLSPEEERSHHSDEEEEEENDGGGGGGVLPEDQVFEVLTRVPLDDLPACRMVSARWRRLTYEPAFAPLHCRRAAAVSGYIVQSMMRNRYHADFVSMHGGSPTTPPKVVSLDFLPSAHVRVEAVSAHRGLACCVDADTARYYVCKPATRQWRALPNPRVRFRTAAVAMVALPPSTPAGTTSTTTAAEFKIVRFSFPARPHLLLCEVFDSRRFRWRRAPDVPLCPYSLSGAAAPGAVLAHGAMHWLRWPDLLTGKQDVFAFDVRAETWRLITLPRESDDPWARRTIAAVEGRLCLLMVRDVAAEEVLEVWEMADYGEGKWRKKMTVSLKSLKAKEGPGVIIGDLHSCDVAFMHSIGRVLWYDLRRGKVAEVQVKHFGIQEIFKYESDLIPCDIGSRPYRPPAQNCKF